MTRVMAETRAFELNRIEPKASGLSFAAKLSECKSFWYVAGYFKGEEVSYVRD